MGKRHFAALAVINGAAGEISADWNANHDRATEGVIRAPAHGGKLVANLHHRRPDVVEKLNLGDRFQSACGQPNGAPDDAGLRYRRVEAARAAEFTLQISSRFKDAAFALDRR